MSFFQNVASLLLTTMVRVPIAFATSVMLARYLSLEDRGLYSVSMTFVAVVVLLGQFGWPNAAIYRLRSIGSAPDRVVGAGLVALLALCSLVVLGCLVARPLITENFLEGASARVYMLALAIIPFQIIAIFFTGVARGIDRFRLQNGYTFSRAAGLFLALSSVLVFLSAGVEKALVATLCVQATLTLALAAAVIRRTGFSLRFDASEVAESLRFGLKSYLHAIAGQIHERVDIFMIAYFLKDPTEVAYYTVAAALVEQLKMIPVAINAASYPQLAGLGEVAGAHFVCRISRHTLLWVGLSAVFFAAITPFIVPLIYGERYASSVPPALILIPGMALLAEFRILASYFTAIDRQAVNIALVITSVLVNVALNALWIPEYGILGAAAASFASYSLEMVLITTVFCGLTGLRLSELYVFRREDLGPYRRRARALRERFGR